MIELIAIPVPLPSTCKKCGTSDRYAPTAGRNVGACKFCAVVNATKQKQRNPEKTKANRAAEYVSNKVKADEQSAAYYAKNRAKINKQQAAWRKLNVTKLKAYFAGLYKDSVTGAKIRAKLALWRSANRAKISERNRAYRVRHPDVKRVHAINRRARITFNGGKLTYGLAARLYVLQQGLCPCCKEPLGNDYHRDHITPLALGGENSDGNIQLLRAKCNMQKRAKHPVDFMQERGFLL